MAKQITQYELLISCPGDIIDEVKIIEDVVEKFNQQFSATLGHLSMIFDAKWQNFCVRKIPMPMLV